MKVPLRLVIVTLALGLGVVVLGILQTRKLEVIASIAVQIIAVILTVLITYLPTKYLVAEQEKRVAENRAEIALRHTVALDGQMRETSAYIDAQIVGLGDIEKQGKISTSIVKNTLGNIQTVHDMQFTHIQATAGDWRDILPVLQDNNQNGGKDGSE